MYPLDLVIVITERKLSENYVEFLKENNTALLSMLGHGTAKSEMLDYFGLEATEKAIICCVVSDTARKSLLKGLIRHMRIETPGSGIAFSIPLASVAGSTAAKYFVSGDETCMTETKIEHVPASPFELIIAITNYGFTDMVMDAARSAGATGGTLLHAKGYGKNNKDKFFSMSIAAEKEVVFIISKAEGKTAVMKAILSQAGPKTEAQTAVLTLPVTSVVGIQSFLEDAE